MPWAGHEGKTAPAVWTAGPLFGFEENKTCLPQGCPRTPRATKGFGQSKDRTAHNPFVALPQAVDHPLALPQKPPPCGIGHAPKGKRAGKVDTVPNRLKLCALLRS